MTEIGKRIKQLCDAELGHFLESHGFERKTRTWRRVQGDCMQIVVLEGSRHNRGDSGSFSMHLGVFFPTIEELSRIPGHPSPPELVDEPRCQIRCRLGNEGIPEQERHVWEVFGGTVWEINPDVDVDALSAEIATAMDCYGLAWFEKYSDLRFAYDSQLRFASPLTAAASALAVNKPKDAKRRMYPYLWGLWWHTFGPGSENAKEYYEERKTWMRSHGLMRAKTKK